MMPRQSSALGPRSTGARWGLSTVAVSRRCAILANITDANRSPLWYVYILRCRDGTLYTGIARDVAARIRAHEMGRGARYTRGRGPFELCAKRRCLSQGEALRLEFAIKQLSQANKVRLTLPRRLARFARKWLLQQPAAAGL